MWGVVPSLIASERWSALLLLAALVAIAAMNALTWRFWGLGKDADTRSAERALARAQKANAELVVENAHLTAEVERLTPGAVVSLLHQRMRGTP